MTWGTSGWGTSGWGVSSSGPSVKIISVKQRTIITGSGCARKELLDRSFLVDVCFEVAHASLPTVDLISAEYSLDGGTTFLPATAQSVDFRHTADNPLDATISPTAYNFVWNAFFDLDEDDFEGLQFKITIEDTSSLQVSDTFSPFDVTTVIVDEVEQKKQAGLKRKALEDQASLDFLGFGLLTPFRRGVRDFISGSGPDLVKSAVSQILNTRASSPDGNIVGELPWRPEFGSQLWLLRHKNINDGTSILANTFVTSAFEQEPRAVVQNIEVEELEDTTLLIRVTYGIINENIDANQVILTEVEEIVV